jgi:hypothetical protein
MITYIHLHIYDYNESKDFSLIIKSIKLKFANSSLFFKNGPWTAAPFDGNSDIFLMTIQHESGSYDYDCDGGKTARRHFADSKIADRQNVDTQIVDIYCKNCFFFVLFQRHCHATEKSEAIACARRCRSS